MTSFKRSLLLCACMPLRAGVVHATVQGECFDICMCTKSMYISWCNIATWLVVILLSQSPFVRQILPCRTKGG